MSSPPTEAFASSTSVSARPLRVLWITTKCPWPAVDGGRLLVTQTLQALDPQEVDITLAGPWPQDPATETQLLQAFPAVSKVVCAAPPTSTTDGFSGRLQAALQAAASIITARTPPVTALKHLHSPLRARLVELLSASTYDVIHLEQPHAIGPLPATTTPIVLRAQNVEADLWDRYAAALAWPQRLLAHREAASVKRWERRVAQRARLVLAISEEDRSSFEQLGVNPERLRWLPAAQPLVLPERPLAQLSGQPALVLLGGSSWKPNQFGERHFLGSVWPAISRRHPGAVLHAFGNTNHSHDPSIQTHRSPKDSGEALVAGSILVVPATVTSGVRMKILEALARGLCVVTTEAGARGLSASVRKTVAIARKTDHWVAAVTQLLTPEDRTARVEQGRAALSHDHDPQHVGHQLLEHYRASVRRS